MTELAHQFLDWVAGHPTLALTLLFFVAALDAIFIIGAFVPAGVTTVRDANNTLEMIAQMRSMEGSPRILAAGNPPGW